MASWLIAPQGTVRHLAIRAKCERGPYGGWVHQALCGNLHAAEDSLGEYKTRMWRWSGRWAEQWPRDELLPVCSRCVTTVTEMMVAAAGGDDR